MKNKLTYFILSNTSRDVIAMIYEHPEYGRTLVMHSNLELENLSIYEWKNGESKKIAEGSYTEYIYSMLQK